MKTETRQLICNLTDFELINKSTELSNLLVQKEELNNEKSKISQKIKDIEGNIRITSDIIREKKEFRDIECYWNIDIDDNKKHLHRKDTGDIIMTLDLKDKDIQSQIDHEV